MKFLRDSGHSDRVNLRFKFQVWHYNQSTTLTTALVDSDSESTGRKTGKSHLVASIKDFISFFLYLQPELSLGYQKVLNSDLVRDIKKYLESTFVQCTEMGFASFLFG